jgi:hypothetical protein
MYENSGIHLGQLQFAEKVGPVLEKIAVQNWSSWMVIKQKWPKKAIVNEKGKNARRSLQDRRLLCLWFLFFFLPRKDNKIHLVWCICKVV